MPTTWSEDAETSAQGSNNTATEIPEDEVIEVDEKTKKVISYSRRADGVLEKRTRTYRVERKSEKVSKAVLERRKWAKYGAAARKSAHEASTTSVADEVFLVLRTEPETGNEPEEKAKPKAVKPVTCRKCGGAHFTSKCTFAGDVSATGGPGAAPSAAEPAAAAGKPDIYVPKHKRNEDGTRRTGSSMERDDSCSIKIINLGEETVDEDIRNLCKPFGHVVRIYLAKDKETGLAREFAFANFTTRRDAAAAIEGINGHKFGHMILKAEWSKPKTKN